MADLTLHNGMLGGGRPVDVSIESGRISAIGPPGSAATADEVHDLTGFLLLAPFAEPHAHLDKALTAERIPNPRGDLPGAVQAWEEAMLEGWFGPADIAARATRALDRMLVNGVTAVRTHVNVSQTVGSAGVEAVREVADRYRGVVDVQIVALTTPPMTGEAGAANRAALEAALAAGADLVGGAPQLDPDPEAQIDHALDVAGRHGRALDLHVDETLDPSVLTLRHLARRVVQTGFEPAVTASHCVSLGVQDPSTQIEVAHEVVAAGVSVVALPQTNLFLQGRDHPSGPPRGLTAVAALAEAGATVAAGADNVEDPYNPVGRSDPLETAGLMIMTTHRLPDDALAMVSGEARRAMGLSDTGLEIGEPADFVTIEAASVREAIARAPGTRRVYRAGRIVAHSDRTASIGDRSVD